MIRSNNNSNNGSAKRDTEVYVVDFKTKECIAVFINESDKTVLGYLAKNDMSPIKIVKKKLSVSECENVLRFHQRVA